MFLNSRGAAHSYANVGLETGVLAASPVQLIVMLYEGAELAVRKAIRHIGEGDLAKKSAAISQASAIVLDGLRAALDLKHGGDIALQLDALYDYMNKRLMLAHLNNQTAPLEEVLGLLRELHDAWLQVAPAGRAASASGYQPVAA
ncbi:MAG: flagellar export chaperone FliS [Betaproteobacteria bacterium]|nr:flagellar export chaperone FliS [Betaproteobacteria bacterium]